MNSNHFLVVAKIRARNSTMKEGKRASQKRYLMDRLKHAEVRGRYEFATEKNREFSAAPELNGDSVDAVNEEWENLGMQCAEQLKKQ